MPFGEFSDQLGQVVNPQTRAAVKDQDRDTFALDPSGQMSSDDRDGERFTCHGARLQSARHSRPVWSVLRFSAWVKLADDTR
jgi:hypothetical protein